VGDAIGTAIPLLCTAIIFLPRHLCRLLEVQLPKFIRESYFYPAIFCIPMALVLILMQRNFYAHRYPQLLVNLLAGGITYGVGVIWFVLTHESIGMELRGRVGRYFAPTDALDE
jgi:predicted membrane channel-forming protein YqfA (hemolysin III family)